MCRFPIAVILQAVSIAEVRVMSMTEYGMTREIWIAEFVETVINGTATAFAQVCTHQKSRIPGISMYLFVSRRLYELIDSQTRFPFQLRWRISCSSDQRGCWVP